MIFPMSIISNFSLVLILFHHCVCIYVCVLIYCSLKNIIVHVSHDSSHGEVKQKTEQLQQLVPTKKHNKDDTEQEWKKNQYGEPWYPKWTILGSKRGKVCLNSLPTHYVILDTACGHHIVVLSGYVLRICLHFPSLILKITNKCICVLLLEKYPSNS